MSYEGSDGPPESGIPNRKARGPNKKAKRLLDEENNPCLSEANASYKCLRDTNYERDLCYHEFVTYKNCKKFWNNVMINRRRKGIKPPLPPPEDRDQIRNGIDYNNQ
ncbi:coiled-coil-helix-coiled-coil-helix domain-containing protein 7-like [Saccoglossus kowalevskii]|uniref:Coiled-coil-helix-coiled-coil-helix domain-containing protein 7 n=1 Tax=Saccoglossus kowalevskii TaxID=10224 RepID=A0ABM0GTT5_SACKO|nr:PREDICTED: coiled-coil-helix-coiled-coil-helix domain-containing protein 7-like [Saccoglossus kowalevskii]